jgi:hypothetical protein
MTFEEWIEELESVIENATLATAPTTYRGALIFERLEGVQNAIDDWRQG